MYLVFTFSFLLPLSLPPSFHSFLYFGKALQLNSKEMALTIDKAIAGSGMQHCVPALL